MSELKVNTISNASGTNSISIGSDGSISYPNFGRKNLIINGAMQVAQRGTSVSAKTGGGYHTLDRWNLFQNLGAMNLSQSSDAPDDFSYSLKHEVSTAASPSSTSIVTTVQGIEGYTTAQLNWGTSSAKSVTVSFWVKSSVTGTYGAWMRNADDNRYQTKEFSISSANTWEHITLTFAGDTSGTWATTNGVGINFGITLAAGSTRQGTADVWQTNGAYTTSNQVDWQGTSGATFYITGVQLEVGSVATPFEHRSYGEELALCQRYCYVEDNSDTYHALCNGFAGQTDLFIGNKFVPVQMRSAPTLTYSGSYHVTNSTAYSVSSLSIVDATTSPVYQIRANSSGLTIGAGLQLRNNNDTSAVFILDAEL